MHWKTGRKRKQRYFGERNTKGSLEEVFGDH